MSRSNAFAVIGDPIEHSLSPEIHEPILTQFYDNLIYKRELVKKGHLEDWIQRVKKENIKGFNVTMPHKIDIIPLLDEMDFEANVYQSVNTVVNDQGRLLGYNTDGRGFAMAIKELGYSLTDSTILIMGAGGVAATIALKAIIEKAKSVAILARNPDKAATLIKQANRMDDSGILILDRMTPELLCKYAGTADILVNATPLGMRGIPFDHEDLGFLDELKERALVCDLIYNPEKTTLLKGAELREIKIMGGLDMLIYQGILADELYIGKTLDHQAMYHKVRERIKEKVEII